MNSRYLIPLIAAAALLAACGNRENETPTPTVGDSAGGTADESMGSDAASSAPGAADPTYPPPEETPPPDSTTPPPSGQ